MPPVFRIKAPSGKVCGDGDGLGLGEGLGDGDGLTEGVGLGNGVGVGFGEYTNSCTTLPPKSVTHAQFPPLQLREIPIAA